MYGMSVNNYAIILITTNNIFFKAVKYALLLKYDLLNNKLITLLNESSSKEDNRIWNTLAEFTFRTLRTFLLISLQ